jgi:hypothetical protein
MSLRFHPTRGASFSRRRIFCGAPRSFSSFLRSKAFDQELSAFSGWLWSLAPAPSPSDGTMARL